MYTGRPRSYEVHCGRRLFVKRVSAERDARGIASPTSPARRPSNDVVPAASEGVRDCIFAVSRPESDSQSRKVPHLHAGRGQRQHTRHSSIQSLPATHPGDTAAGGVVHAACGRLSAPSNTAARVHATAPRHRQGPSTWCNVSLAQRRYAGMLRWNSFQTGSYRHGWFEDHCLRPPHWSFQLIEWRGPCATFHQRLHC